MSKVALRQCLGCREMKPKDELIRIVRSPQGEISTDMTGKKQGRGAYLCYDGKCFKRIVKTKALSRVLKTQVSEEVLQHITQQIDQFSLEVPDGS
jgi:predicted RNA-binding protein YlxR (DUF448 family)